MSRLELLLHYGVAALAVVCLTVLGSERVISGDSVGSFVTTVLGLNGMVTGVAVWKRNGKTT